MKPIAEISIVMPVYNAERSLRACLDSVVRQTMSGIEVIAVDDRSTDGSSALLREDQCAYPDRVKVLRTENRSANHARHEAMRQVTGEHVPDVAAGLFARQFEQINVFAELY